MCMKHNLYVPRLLHKTSKVCAVDSHPVLVLHISVSKLHTRVLLYMIHRHSYDSSVIRVEGTAEEVWNNTMRPSLTRFSINNSASFTSFCFHGKSHHHLLSFFRLCHSVQACPSLSVFQVRGIYWSTTCSIRHCLVGKCLSYYGYKQYYYCQAQSNFQL